MPPIYFAGKTYYWYTNIRGTAIGKQTFREIHPDGIIGDPIPSDRFKTTEIARKNNQLGGYVPSVGNAIKETIEMTIETVNKITNAYKNDEE